MDVIEAQGWDPGPGDANAIELLQEYVECLEREVELLASRIHVVLRPTSPAVDQVCTRDAAPHAQSPLRVLALRVDAARRNLTETITRVDL